MIVKSGISVLFSATNEIAAPNKKHAQPIDLQHLTTKQHYYIKQKIHIL